VRLALKVVMQNGGDFVDVILLYIQNIQHRRAEVRMWSHNTQLYSS